MASCAWLRRGVLWCGITGALAAQPPAAPVLQEHVTVDVQLIDVVATDDAGAPLRGLTRENFVVEIDGRPREVVSVDGGRAAVPRAADAPAATATSQTMAPAPAPSEPRWMLLLFDADHIASFHRKVALDHARSLLRAARPEDRVSMSVLRGGRVESVFGFTPASRVDAARLSDPKAIAGRSYGYRQRVADLLGQLEACAGRVHPDLCADQAGEEFIATSRGESGGVVTQLRGAVAALAPLPGRKALVLFTDGLVLEPATLLLDAVAKVLPDQDAAIRSRLNDEAPAEFEDAVASASRSRVSLFAFRTGGEMGGGLGGADRGSNAYGGRLGLDPFETALRLQKGSLFSAAEATGGSTIEVGGRAREAAPVLDRLDAVYTIAVRREPADGARPAVRVRLAGVSGHLDAPARVWNPGAANALDARIEVGPPQGDLARVHVVFVRRSLTPAKGDDPSHDRRALVAVYWRLVDAHGATVKDAYDVLRIAPDGMPLAVLPLEFRPGPGAYVLEVHVSDLLGHGRADLGAPIRM